MLLALPSRALRRPRVVKRMTPIVEPEVLTATTASPCSADPAHPAPAHEAAVA
jgi:hypothetical protein